MAQPFTQPDDSGADPAPPAGAQLTVHDESGKPAVGVTVTVKRSAWFGVIGESGEGDEIDANVDGSTSPVGGGAAEQIEIDVGPELVHAAVLAALAQALGETVDVLSGDDGPVGWKVEGAEVGGAVSGGFDDDSAIGDSLLVAAQRVVRVDGDGEFADSGSQLSGRQMGRVADDPIRDGPCGVVVEMGCLPDDGAGSALVDQTGRQGVSNPWEAIAQVE